MAKKGNRPGDKVADFALDKISDSLDDILPPLDDPVLNDVFARLDDFSAACERQIRRGLELSDLDGIL